MTRTNTVVVTLLAALVLASSVLASTLPAPAPLIHPDLKWATPAPPGQYWLSLDAADIDHDGLDEIVAGTTNALYALDGETGLPIWRTPTGAIIRLLTTDIDNDNDLEVITVGLNDPTTWACTPVAVDWTVRVFDARTGLPQVLYLGSLPQGKIGDLKAADLNNDDVLDMVVSTYEWDGNAFNGVFVLDGSTLLGSEKSSSLHIAGDEALLWTYRSPSLPGMRPQNIETHVDPRTGTSMVYFVDPNGDVHAIEGSSGERVWHHGDSARIVQVGNVTGDSSPEVLTDGGDIDILDPHTGQLLQELDPQAFFNEHSAGGGWFVPLKPTHPNNTSIVMRGGARLDGDVNHILLWGLDAEHASLEWTIDLGPAVGPEGGSIRHPVVMHLDDLNRDGAQELVLAQGDSIHLPGITPDTYHQPRVLVIDPAEGRILWEHWMPGAPTWRFDTGDLDGQGNKEIVTGLWRFIAAWEPQLTDLGTTSDRGPEGFRTGPTCLTPE